MGVCTRCGSDARSLRTFTLDGDDRAYLCADCFDGFETRLERYLAGGVTVRPPTAQTGIR